MGYSTATTIVNEYSIFPQTTTVQRYTETTALITAKIPRADATIDSYCARRYSIPFSPTPPKIGEISVKLSAYLALQAKFTRDSHNTNDWVELIGKEAMDDLKLIRDRKIDLVNTAGALLTENTADSRIVSSTEDYQPFADFDNETEWKVDSDRLDAIDRT